MQLENVDDVQGQFQSSMMQAEQVEQSDELTGLAVRTQFQTVLQREFDRAQRYSNPLSLIIIDVDRMTRINDRFGQEAGDQALVHLTDVLRANLRGVDFAARIGGEELGAILPSTQGDVAMRVADRLREALHQDPPMWRNIGPLFFTVSVGIAAYPEDAEGPETLLSRATEALKEAKRVGRDRTVRFHQKYSA
jgi:two-component system, cell cycle response regulator